ncbi:MAG: tetratricopeptide repeat protein [Alphaproteobacteria bacterium]|nr:tetratricopeptide repeat protein [Alphaproteobacteria bacterium]
MASWTDRVFTLRRGLPLATSLLALGLGSALAAPQQTTPAAAPAKPAPAKPADAGPDPLIGAYLAGRQAQQTRDFTEAASWYEKALAIDPDAPELINRTFLTELCVGHFDRARELAPKVLKLDPSDGMAQLTLVIQHLQQKDAAGAAKLAAALPTDGVHRFIGPFALAWTRMAAGDLAGADMALQGLDKFNGFEPLKAFQLGLLYDFAGQPDKAQQFYDKAISSSQQLNWRLTEAIANFDLRRGRTDQAKQLYKRFLEQNPTSDLAMSVMSSQGTTAPQPLLRNASDGFAEAMFDLASVLNQAETIDLSLLYDRFALAIRPQFPLAQLLLADTLSAENRPDQSLALLGEIPQGTPYYWSARLRAAVNLDTLERSDEAIAQLKTMTAEKPDLIAADAELGDILRNKKRYAESVTAYDEALKRTAADGLPERWSLFYDRGVALERAGEWKRAETDLTHALDLKPDQPMVLNYLGYSWIDRGENLDKGLKMIEKAVELKPDDGYIVDSLGWAHYRMGDYAGATEYLEKAIELVPEDPTINDHLGDAYWQTGRMVEARYQWKRALQFNPQESDVKPIEAKLEHGLNASASPPHGG